MCNDLAEILGAVCLCLNVLTAWESHSACSINPVLIAVAGRYQTVGSQQDGTAEGVKFLFLLPPCISIIPREVAVLFKRRIIMRRQHLRMGIDIHSGSLGLLQQHLQISQIVTGDQNCRIFPDADADFGDLGISIVPGIGFVQKRHHIYAVLACLHHKGNQLIPAESIIHGLRKGRLEKGVDLRLLFSQCIGVL